MLLQDSLHDWTETVLNNKEPTQSELKYFELQKQIISTISTKPTLKNKLFDKFFDVLLTVHLSTAVLSQPVHGTATHMCDDKRCCIIQF